jgi:putative glutamine amidotransferase
MTQEAERLPRVGVPWRSAMEESAKKRDRYDDYLNAVREAGGEPVEVSLRLPEDRLRQLAESLDAVVLSGSPADVNPGRFGTARHAAAADADPDRERTDDVLLDHALAADKPVLAICYGAQLLNVHLGGSLLQDIPSELPGTINHDREENESERLHAVRIERGHLAELLGQAEETHEIQTNSSHHQAVLKPGRGLRITARAKDGVVEAVEWEGGLGWVVGVQWHPERMHGDMLARALFRKLVAEARGSAASRKKQSGNLAGPMSLPCIRNL